MMESDFRPNFCLLTGSNQRTVLMRLGPGRLIRVGEDERIGITATDHNSEEIPARLGQWDMSRPTALRVRNRDCPGIRIEVHRPKTREFGVSASGFERRSHKRPKLGTTASKQSLALSKREIANTRSIGPLELHDSTPGLVGLDAALAPSMIETRLQNRQQPIRRRLSTPARFRLLTVRARQPSVPLAN